MVPIRLYALGIVGVAVVSGLVWGGHKLYVFGYDAAVLENQNLITAQERIAKAVETRIANKINGITIKHVTIRQNLEKEFSHDVVYRECVASERVFELTNEAITGSSEPVTDSVVPTAEPINGQNF